MGTHWAEVLLFIVVCAQFYCLTACITSGSRMLFAFSRDRAVPGHQWWRWVSRHRVPVWAAVGAGFVGFLLLLPTWWNNLAGYYVGTSVGTTGLYIAFILPVILRFRAGANFERGAWSLGKHYKWINVIAILWVAFISIIFMLPTSPAGSPGTPLSRGTRSTTRRSRSSARSSSSAAGGSCRRRSGSRARCGWAQRTSSRSSRRSRRTSSCSRLTRSSEACSRSSLDEVSRGAERRPSSVQVRVR